MVFSVSLVSGDPKSLTHSCVIPAQKGSPRLKSEAKDLEPLRDLEIDKSANEVIRGFIGVVLESGSDQRRIVVGDVVDADRQAGAAERPAPFFSEAIGKLHINGVPTIHRPTGPVDGEAAAAGHWHGRHVARIDGVREIVEIPRQAGGDLVIRQRALAAGIAGVKIAVLGGIVETAGEWIAVVIAEQQVRAGIQGEFASGVRVELIVAGKYSDLNTGD